MANNINISQGDIPETDAEVEKLLAKKPAKRGKKLSLVQAPEAKQEKQPAKIVVKHIAMAWHSSVNGLECYGYTSQEILDVADKVYTLYQQTPTIHLYGECLYGDKVLRLSQEQGVYVNVTNDAWHLPLLVQPRGNRAGVYR